MTKHDTCDIATEFAHKRKKIKRLQAEVPSRLSTSKKRRQSLCDTVGSRVEFEIVDLEIERLLEIERTLFRTIHSYSVEQEQQL